MSIIKPFKGLRPLSEKAAKVASPPYDVLNSQEARKMAEGNPLSFLHINKPEIDLDPGIDVYSEDVYNKGAENLQKFIKDGILQQDEKECFYIYRQIMGEHQQYGLVALASVDEYDSDKIKKHEFTRPEKEDDRVQHMDHLNAQVGPVFLTYKAHPSMDKIVERISKQKPEIDFIAIDEIQHTVWVINEDEDIRRIIKVFESFDCLYVADGHHRSAAASRICKMRKDKNSNHTGNESYNYFLNVIFPDNQMYIMDYNRVVKDLNGLNSKEFLGKIAENFEIKKLGPAGFKPMEKNSIVMYLDKQWYLLLANEGSFNHKDPVASLDVSILQDNLLAPVLGIGDPRKDKRIDFVGGIRGLEGLQDRVDSGEMAVAFALFPTSIEDLMKIADAGKVMPPKSTWFEPKLRSGLFVHLLD
ncbi:MAG: DUF1015 domain-containing protein [Calditrichae bacterium]|nr:DUF1015 domain-containing protein [Calditrichota bacterium]MCB9057095.1 DUF1015 domain-containing protein [Calditrichia bacterium]